MPERGSSTQSNIKKQYYFEGDRKEVPGDHQLNRLVDKFSGDSRFDCQNTLHMGIVLSGESVDKSTVNERTTLNKI